MTREARHGLRASTAAPGRGAGGLGGPKIHSGVPGSRRLGNARGRGKGGEEEGGKPKEQRPSLPTGDKIRLPSARGEKGLPTLPPEVSSGGRPGVNRQGNADDKPSPGSPKTKPSGKHRSLVESSPYAVSTCTTNNTLWMISTCYRDRNHGFVFHCICCCSIVYGYSCFRCA